MRLIKPRSQQSSTPEGDLRGLGSDLIVKSPSPFACLTYSSTQTLPLEEITAQFNLKHIHKEKSPFSHLIVQHLKEGEHKLQAMTLVAASLAIHEHLSHFTSHIHIVNPVKTILQKGQSFASLEELVLWHGTHTHTHLKEGIHLSEEVVAVLREAEFTHELSHGKSLTHSEIQSLMNWFQSSHAQEKDQTDTQKVRQGVAA